MLDRLGPSALAAALSTLVYEARRPEDVVSPRVPGGDTQRAVDDLERLWRELSAVEREHRLDFLRRPDAGLAWAAYRWAEGDDLAEVLDESDLTAGDFVRWVKQLIDLCGQVADAAGAARSARTPATSYAGSVAASSPWHRWRTEPGRLCGARGCCGWVNEPMGDTELLVIGAGPYAYSAAAHARARGIRTRIVGRPMSFWREQMPVGHVPALRPRLDARRRRCALVRGVLRGTGPTTADEHDPIPISVFLDHTEWFREQKELDVEQVMVESLAAPDGRFEAAMSDGSTITAERVLAAPGIAHFAQLPAWYAEVPADRRTHTSERVAFDDLSGARVAVIGGRQSAYEWAALLCDHGAARVDVVHRHDTPAFEKVSWAFVDAYVEQTEAERGWWRSLSAARQQEITLEFWQVGRLTLEPWLTPRLAPDVVTSRPRTEVVSVEVVDPARVRLALSDGDRLEVDHVIAASGYRADLAAVPYLAGVLDRVSVTDGFPDLPPGFETTLPGLYVTGFAATRDFGPFYGFTKGCPSAARIAVGEMLR